MIHRMAEVGKYLWKLSTPSSLLKAAWAKAGSSGPSPVRYWIFPGTETPQVFWLFQCWSPTVFYFFFFLIVIFFLYFKLCPLPLSLSLDVNEKNLFIGVSPQVFILVDKIPLSLLLSSLSLSLYDKSLIYLCGPLLHLLQHKHVSFVL